MRDQVVQVFLNLILNALDATEEGTTIEITTDVYEGKIRIRFKDHGHGIKSENYDAIFKPYYTTKDTGTGLGLFVCRNIIQKFEGGRIELTESSSQGSTFTVFLGISDSSSASAQESSNKKTGSKNESSFASTSKLTNKL